MTHCFSSWFLFYLNFAGGVPNEIRTRVTAVKGRCPKPLDDGNNLFPFFFYFFCLLQLLLFRFCFLPCNPVNDNLCEH